MGLGVGIALHSPPGGATAPGAAFLEVHFPDQQPKKKRDLSQKIYRNRLQGANFCPISPGCPGRSPSDATIAVKVRRGQSTVVVGYKCGKSRFISIGSAKDTHELSRKPASLCDSLGDISESGTILRRTNRIPEPSLLTKTIAASLRSGLVLHELESDVNEDFPVLKAKQNPAGGTRLSR